MRIRPTISSRTGSSTIEKDGRGQLPDGSRAHLSPLILVVAAVAVLRVTQQPFASSPFVIGLRLVCYSWELFV
jgi:hypothetical protein